MCELSRRRTTVLQLSGCYLVSCVYVCSCMASLCPLLCIKKGQKLSGGKEKMLLVSLICMACCVGVCVCVHAWLAVYIFCVFLSTCVWLSDDIWGHIRNCGVIRVCVKWMMKHALKGQTEHLGILIYSISMSCLRYLHDISTIKDKKNQSEFEMKPATYNNLSWSLFFVLETSF